MRRRGNFLAMIGNAHAGGSVSNSSFRICGGVAFSRRLKAGMDQTRGAYRVNFGLI